MNELPYATLFDRFDECWYFWNYNTRGTAQEVALAWHKSETFVNLYIEVYIIFHLVLTISKKLNIFNLNLNQLYLTFCLFKTMWFAQTCYSNN